MSNPTQCLRIKFPYTDIHRTSLPKIYTSLELHCITTFLISSDSLHVFICYPKFNTLDYKQTKQDNS